MQTTAGAEYHGNNNCSFTVWAPIAKQVKLRLVGPGKKRTIAMERDDLGYWDKTVEGVAAGTRYYYQLDNLPPKPDPASHFQPKGVHGPSEVLDHTFGWRDKKWQGIPLEKMLIYELHVGAFTKEGTFDGIIKRLKDLHELGVSALEIMPISQFPGERNWGYDGVYPYAVQNSYGGPTGFKKLVNACHQSGLAVILDVVYNHLGPEGNYLREFGPYFTSKYKTPWGEAINFDGPDSDQVREFFIQNAIYWFREYHIDSLRLDALHAIYDASAKHVIQELTERVEKFSRDHSRKFYLIGESDLNDAKLIRPRAQKGYGLDAQWNDDFHHSLHTLLTKEQTGYYQDFGRIGDLAKAFKEGFVYSGAYSKYRKRRHGNNSKNRSAEQFVVCIQNHDQIGNRMLGERLSQLVGFEALKLAAGTVILSPYVPLLFMGEEYAEESPFQYFVSHTDRKLIKAVQNGRKNEFKSFGWKSECPDPQAISTFKTSKLKWQKRDRGRHKIMLDFYKTVIALRKSIPGFVDKKNISVRYPPDRQILHWHRKFGRRQLQCLMNFSNKEQKLRIYAPAKEWTKILDSSDVKWAGPGSKLPATIGKKKQVTLPPLSLALFEERRGPKKAKAPRKRIYAHSHSHV